MLILNRFNKVSNDGIGRREDNFVVNFQLFFFFFVLKNIWIEILFSMKLKNGKIQKFKTFKNVNKLQVIFF